MTPKTWKHNKQIHIEYKTGVLYIYKLKYKKENKK